MLSVSWVTLAKKVKFARSYFLLLMDNNIRVNSVKTILESLVYINLESVVYTQARVNKMKTRGKVLQIAWKLS